MHVRQLKQSFENARKRFKKARNNTKKSNVSVTSFQEAKEAAGNIEGYGFLTCGPFHLQFAGKKSILTVKVALSERVNRTHLKIRLLKR